MADTATTTKIDSEDIGQLEAGRMLVVQQLEEAHATEAALVTTLSAHISMTPQGGYRKLLERHLQETKDQAQAIQERLGELGAHRSIVASGFGLAQTVVGQALALGKGPIDLLRGRAGEEKLLKNAKDECATEALEIATYDALEATARAVGDGKTADLAARHRKQEERTLEGLRKLIPSLAEAYVRAVATGDPSYDVSRTGAADSARQVRDEVAGEAGELKDAAAKRSRAAKRRVEKATA
jgi:ferritin-like metal-binding protein YciE